MPDGHPRNAPAGIVIREARHDEAEQVADVIRRAFATEVALYGEVPPMRERAEDVVDTLDSGDVALVAEADGRVVGTARGETLATGAVMVRRLAVDPAWRGRGIARELMIALETAYPDAPRFEVFTGSLSVGPLALYESLGYRRVRSENVAPGVDLVYLEKPAT
jgi:predicted N-acetyltransferase YhbS